MNQETVEVIATAKGLGSTIAGSAVALYGGFTANEWAVLVGVVVGVGGLCVQCWTQYHAHQERKVRMKALYSREKRDIERHKATMAELQRGCSVVELPVYDSLGDMPND